MARTIYIYNENCTMSGREVPQRELERYEDPNDGGDWTGYEVSEEQAGALVSGENPSIFQRRVAATIRAAM